MPEPDLRIPLDQQLARGRADLLDRIEQPPLARIQHRAAHRRRRGHSVVAGAMVALVVAGAAVVRPWGGGVDQAPPPVAEAPAVGPIYTGDEITINGLAGNPPDVPGRITDVEFTDPDHGYLLAECLDVGSCPASVARTSDGGVSWQSTSLPDATEGRSGLELIAFPDGRLVVAGDTPYASTDGGRTWRTGAPVSPGLIQLRPGDHLRRQPARAEAGECGGTVQVWRSGELTQVGTVDPGAVDVCWVAPDATADGAWWIGGIRDGQPVAAATRDAGTTWTTVPLDTPAGGAAVRVAVLGSHAYATVLGPGGAILGLFRSTDNGHTFTRTSTGSPVGAPDGVSGDLVPLLDGRLLVAGTDNQWYVSADDGHSFTRTTGTLPAVGRLARTDAGYVAYELFSNGWAAYSADGSTWRKLQIH